ncbi:MAG: STAS domain-containing protein [Gemmatimonadetes bacterium]|nr:MAG: STAS domain-containing protein [Gemmatimonadota bacterium]
MKAQDFILSDALKFHPEVGKLLLGDERMLLFRQEAFTVLRKLLFEQLGDDLANGWLFQFGYRCGHGDFGVLSTLYDWDTDADRLACGPIMHTWEGIVQVEPVQMEFDLGSGHFYFRGIWRNSYEAEIHLKEFGKSKVPTCFSLTGYASGWCSAFMGKPLLAIETKCIGKGDEQCEWEIKPYDTWGPEADLWRRASTATESSLTEDLEEKMKVIEEQQEAMLELSTPVIQIWEGILILPLIGTIDSRRAGQIMQNTLNAVSQHRAKQIIIDITGVPFVDTEVANHLIKTIQAAKLVGAKCILVGISSEVAQTLVHIGIDLEHLDTFATLEDGLQEALYRMKFEICRV